MCMHVCVFVCACVCVCVCVRVDIALPTLLVTRDQVLYILAAYLLSQSFVADIWLFAGL